MSIINEADSGAENADIVVPAGDIKSPLAVPVVMNMSKSKSSPGKRSKRATDAEEVKVDKKNQLKMSKQRTEEFLQVKTKLDNLKRRATLAKN